MVRVIYDTHQLWNVYTVCIFDWNLIVEFDVEFDLLYLEN